MLITLLRHADPDWCPDSEDVSYLDPDITGDGAAETREVADRLAHVGYKDVWQSTLARSGQTARIIGERIDVRPQTCKWLNELRYPKSWDRQPRQLVTDSLERHSRKPLYEMRSGHGHNSETYPHFWIRVRQGFRDALRPWAQRLADGPWSPLWQPTPGGNDTPILIVGHHGSLDIITRELLSIPGSQPYITFDLSFLQAATFRLVPMSVGHVWQLQHHGTL